MYFIPLNQVESVQLIVNALKSAGGEGNCKSCPAFDTCEHQCLNIASAVESMLERGTLPQSQPKVEPVEEVIEERPMGKVIPLFGERK